MSRYKVRYWLDDEVVKTYPVTTIEEGMERVLEGPHDPDAEDGEYEEEYEEYEEPSSFAELIRKEDDDTELSIFWCNDDCKQGSDLDENDPDYGTVAKMAKWD